MLAQLAAHQARTPSSEQSTNHILYFLYDVYVLICLLIQVYISALIVLCCLTSYHYICSIAVGANMKCGEQFCHMVFLRANWSFDMA